MTELAESVVYAVPYIAIITLYLLQKVVVFW